MTEEEWLEESDVQALLRPLGTRKIDKRKLRLLGCAFCRRLRSPCTEQSRRIELAEMYADGLVKTAELHEAESAALRILELSSWSSTLEMGESQHARKDAAEAVFTLLMPNCNVASIVRIAALIRSAALGILKEETMHAHLVRDVFTNRIRKSKTHLASALLTWRDATIPKLAHAAYDERELPSGHLDAKRLAILADALEEAGCTNEDVLAHLRGPGPHVRGCWVLDLLLGRE
jgi:hypothetical protein